MRFAIITDIHANREALTACMADARRRGIDRFAFLGDIVGYGADPEAVTDTVMEEVARGAVAVRGNHDDALVDMAQPMSVLARTVLDWTRPRLDSAQTAFLTGQPFSQSAEGLLFVHANAADPAGWGYIDGSLAAEYSLAVARENVVFCGHIHVGALYHQPPQRPVSHFEPVPGVAVPLSHLRRWLAVVPSCGQPRDGNPAAGYAIYDSALRQLTVLRIGYDVETSAQKVLRAGLPVRLAQRLAEGR